MTAYEGCTEMRVELGAYVLGAISPAERSQIDTHLAICPACRDELAGLAGLPALLSRVEEAQIAEVAGAPGELLDSLLEKAAARRPGRVRRWTPPAVAAAVLLAVGIVVGGMLGDNDRPARPAAHSAPPAATATVEPAWATDPRTHVSAWLGLVRRVWGTAVIVHLQGVPPGTHCDLVAVDKNGRSNVAAGWEVGGWSDAGRYAATTFYGSTMFSRDEIRAFEIRTGQGRRLLNIPVS